MSNILVQSSIILLSVKLLATVMIQSFRTDSSGQTVQTQIRLLLEEQSDQGLHCLQFHCIFLTKYPKVWPLFLNFRQIVAKFFMASENFGTLRYTMSVSSIRWVFDDN